MTETPASPFEIQTERRDGVRIVRISGELDLGTHERLGEHLEAEAGNGEPVIVDLEGCEFIDSSGVRALLIGMRASTESGASLSLAAPGEQVRRILEMTGVDSSIPVHESVDAALSAQG